MLEGSSIVLDMMYVVPGMPLPEPPEHDIALVAIDESDETAPALREIAQLVKVWPRPVINAPERIAQLTRAGTWELLKSAPGVVMPMNVRIGRKTFADIAAGHATIESVHGGGFPIIARPFWSQAGMGLVRLDDAPLSTLIWASGWTRNPTWPPFSITGAATAYSAKPASPSSRAGRSYAKWRFRSTG
jgi:hypothetical protein